MDTVDSLIRAGGVKMAQEMVRRKLPGGDPTFEGVREPGCVYVDKTAVIHKLITGNWKATFLSRPRRFGKSLLCSTLEALFAGRRELFGEITGADGAVLRPALAIDKLPWDWTDHPVIHLDLSMEDYSDGKVALNSLLESKLRLHATLFGVTLTDNRVAALFESLIITTRMAKNRKVVVLIDEYDAPLLDTLEMPKVHEELRQSLTAFYKVLKGCSQHLRFVFLTGIAKFPRVSVFSSLNNLRDISMDPEFADICGITHDELLATFGPEIEAVLARTGCDRDAYLDKLRRYYDGYRFTESKLTVYNPYALLNHFQDRGRFSPYWYDTGTPNYMVQIVEKHGPSILDLGDMRIGLRDLDVKDAVDVKAEALLFQTGYLTIKDYEAVGETYTLDFPNMEVESAFYESLINTHIVGASKERYDRTMIESLRAGDVPKLVGAMRTMFAGITYAIQKEKHQSFQLVTLTTLKMLKVHCDCEYLTSDGRIDCLIKVPHRVYILEFKIDSPALEALKQIDDKEYPLQFEGSGKTVYKVGVSFSGEHRRIVEAAYAVVGPDGQSVGDVVSISFGIEASTT